MGKNNTADNPNNKASTKLSGICSACVVFVALFFQNSSRTILQKQKMKCNPIVYATQTISIPKLNVCSMFHKPRGTYIRNVRRWPNCMFKSSSVCAWCLRLKSHFSTPNDSHQGDVCVCPFSHMRASLIRTKNERNTDYTDDTKILSPNQTESAVKYEHILHTRTVQWMQLSERPYFKFWHQRRYTFGHASALSLQSFDKQRGRF